MKKKRVMNTISGRDAVEIAGIPPFPLRENFGITFSLQHF